LKTFLNAVVFHCRLAVASSLILEEEEEEEDIDEAEEYIDLDIYNADLLALLQETEQRRIPNYFMTLIKASKFVKDCCEAEKMVQLPLYQAVPPEKSMIRKKDGKVFGLEWLQGLFDKLLVKLSKKLTQIYRGQIWQPVVMSWTQDKYNRQVLAPDLAAITYLCRRWDIASATVETSNQFSTLVAE
jgi:hypothetical protein